MEFELDRSTGMPTEEAIFVMTKDKATTLQYLVKNGVLVDVANEP